jgi:nitrilase
MGETALLTAQIDTADIVGARYDLDVVGHYARPDIFTLMVDERARGGTVFVARGTDREEDTEA